MANPPRTVIVAGIPRTVAALIVHANGVVQAMTDNKATFPKPVPTLTKVTADIAALVAAETAAKTKTKGAVQTRDTKRATLIADLNQLHAYTQQLADANPAHAPSIAQAAGLTVRKAAARTKTDSAVASGKVSGSVTLTAKARSARESNDWQYSTDGKTWTPAPSSLQAKTTIPALTPAVLTYFRHRAVTKDGPTDWSQTVSIIVR